MRIAIYTILPQLHWGFDEDAIRRDAIAMKCTYRKLLDRIVHGLRDYCDITPRVRNEYTHHQSARNDADGYLLCVGKEIIQKLARIPIGVSAKYTLPGNFWKYCSQEGTNRRTTTGVGRIFDAARLIGRGIANYLRPMDRGSRQ